MIPQRVLSGTCEITTGAFSVTKRPPLYTADDEALMVEITFTFKNVDFSIPATCHVQMYLKYPNTDNVTSAVELSVDGNTATGYLTAEQTAIAGYPLLVVQMTDEETMDVIVAMATPIKIEDVSGNIIISSRSPSPSEIVYIGHSPYINTTTGTWMEWDVETKTYVDTEVVARGLPATFTATASGLPAGSTPTATISGTAVNPILNLGIPKGDTGAAAGFGTVTATADATSSASPTVTVTPSGPDTAKNFAFAFSGLKGAKGDKGDKGDSGASTAEEVSTDAIAGVDNVEDALSSLSDKIDNLQIVEYDPTDQSLVFRSSDVAAYDATDNSIIINI